MSHEISLISTIAVSLAFAFFGGFIAARLNLPPLVGYLLAGISVGPFTPGFVADTKLAPQLAEIGVILLMFGVGMHISLADFWKVSKVAIPGAVGQTLVTTGMAVGIAFWFGWPAQSGIILGLALSVASTVVLLQALQSRGKLESEGGRIAVGWTITEDLLTVIVLVLLPALAFLTNQTDLERNQIIVPGNPWFTLGLTFGKIAIFAGLMLIIGKRIFPWLLKKVEQTGSRELFTLAVVSLALGVAFGSAQLFGVTFALGAFFAGIVINESDLSRQAASELLPLQNAFTVLFFVSIGMLFNPIILVRHPFLVLMVVTIIIAGKFLVASGIMLAMRHSVETALILSAALAQAGELSFILADQGRSLGLLPSDGYNLIVAGALISIILNPFIFFVVSRWLPA